MASGTTRSAPGPGANCCKAEAGGLLIIVFPSAYRQAQAALEPQERQILSDHDARGLWVQPPKRCSATHPFCDSVLTAALPIRFPAVQAWIDALGNYPRSQSSVGSRFEMTTAFRRQYSHRGIFDDETRASSPQRARTFRDRSWRWEWTSGCHTPSPPRRLRGEVRTILFARESQVYGEPCWPLARRPCAPDARRRSSGGAAPRSPSGWPRRPRRRRGCASPRRPRS